MNSSSAGGGSRTELMTNEKQSASVKEEEEKPVLRLRRILGKSLTTMSDAEFTINELYGGKGFGSWLHFLGDSVTRARGEDIGATRVTFTNATARIAEEAQSVAITRVVDKWKEDFRINKKGEGERNIPVETILPRRMMTDQTYGVKRQQPFTKITHGRSTALRLDPLSELLIIELGRTPSKFDPPEVKRGPQKYSFVKEKKPLKGLLSGHAAGALTFEDISFETALINAELSRAGDREVSVGNRVSLTAVSQGEEQNLDEAYVVTRVNVQAHDGSNRDVDMVLNVVRNKDRKYRTNVVITGYYNNLTVTAVTRITTDTLYVEYDLKREQVCKILFAKGRPEYMLNHRYFSTDQWSGLPLKTIRDNEPKFDDAPSFHLGRYSVDISNVLSLRSFTDKNGVLESITTRFLEYLAGKMGSTVIDVRKLLNKEFLNMVVVGEGDTVFIISGGPFDRGEFRTPESKLVVRIDVEVAIQRLALIYVSKTRVTGTSSVYGLVNAKVMVNALKPPSVRNNVICVYLATKFMMDLVKGYHTDGVKYQHSPSALVPYADLRDTGIFSFIPDQYEGVKPMAVVEIFGNEYVLDTLLYKMYEAMVKKQQPTALVIFANLGILIEKSQTVPVTYSVHLNGSMRDSRIVRPRKNIRDTLTLAKVDNEGMSGARKRVLTNLAQVTENIAQNLTLADIIGVSTYSASTP